MVSSSGSPISGTDIRWRAGLTLQERLALLEPERTHKPPRRMHGRGKSERWRAWRRIDIARSKNLAAISLNPPSWLQDFRAVYMREASPRGAEQVSAGGLLAVSEPLLAAARDRLAQEMQLAPSGLLPSTEEGLRRLLAAFEWSLLERVYDAIAKVLVLELAVAGERNLLVGETPEQRFAFFCECLADPKFARRLLEQYPVLVRRLVTMVSNWETATLGLLSRLAASRRTLVQTFFDGADPGALVYARSAGDSHRRGQAVHVLEFENRMKLVYKPRSVALEHLYCEFVDWFNRAGSGLDLKEVCALDDGAYGWMEFVEAKSCQSSDELELYFQRLGMQLALTYVLGGSDLHFENVIAHGEYPILVDLETLFQTPLHGLNLRGATNLAFRTLQGSVMGTLLLPRPAVQSDDNHITDFSALGHSDGQLTPFRVSVWNGNGTDRMQLVHRRLPMAGGTSLPQLGGTRVVSSRYVEQIVEGLHEAYEVLQQKNTTLLSETGPLAGARGKPVRHVFRATSWYVQLIQASHHPRFVEDAIAAEAFLRNQLQSSTGEERSLEALEDAEVADLLAGDVPYFTSLAGEPDSIVGSRSTGLKPPGNGWAECRARLKGMNKADLERQEWLVRVAMADLSAPRIARPNVCYDALRNPSPATLTATAASIGDRICELAITSGERATWLVPVPADKKRLVVTTAGIDLYNGLSGIALFLGYLSLATSKRRYRQLAAGAIAEALAVYKGSDSAIFPPGAYAGIGGFAYSLVQLARALGRPDWIDEATAILREGARQALGSPEIDVTTGQAGLLMAALATRCHLSDRGLSRELARLADKLSRLARAAQRRGKPRLPAKAQAGIAHGRAGIGVALKRWSDFRHDNPSGMAAQELIASDLKAIDSSTRQSAIRRASDGHHHAELGWCRGPLGIALMSLVGNVQVDRDAARFSELADDIIAGSGEGPLCLCHGALGQLEYIEAMAKSGRLRDPEAAAKWRRHILARLTSGDWVADEAHCLESPGLLLGLAGTGYSLLRAVSRDAIPSVLLLNE